MFFLRCGWDASNPSDSWFSSFSAEKLSKNSAKSSWRSVDIHYLRKFDQANCGGELRIFHRRCYAPGRLCMCKICRYFEDFRRKMIDPAQQTAPASDEDARAQITEIWFLFESALE